MKKINLLLILLISSFLVIYITDILSVESFALSEENSTKTEIKKITEILNIIDEHYVDDIDFKKYSESIINHLLKELDPHSGYFDRNHAQIIKSQLQGGFEGIGIEFNIFDDTIHVITPLIGGPSKKVGILAGDKIIKIDNELVAGKNIKNSDVFQKLRGKKGTKVVVAIARKDEKELLDFTIVRDVIPQHSVEASFIMDDSIGYIKISRFSNSTYDEYMKSLIDLIDRGMNSLIVDLTGNPGGYLHRVVQMVDEVLEKDKMIVYTKGKQRRYDERYFSSKKGIFEKGKIAVLIDESSASASEIFAGAIQDHDRGIIVGRRSFGKGLVQKPMDLKDGSHIRLTISKYYTPSGRSIQKPYKDKNGNTIKHHFSSSEFFHKDSIKIQDTTAYKTAGGRDVYAYGGIIPDYFVPLDTSENSSFLNRLFQSNTIPKFTLQYAEKNKNKISKKDFDFYYNNFQITDQIMDEMLILSKKNNVDFVKTDFKKSEGLIKIILKAHIARKIWDDNAFYKIMNIKNEILQKTLNILKKNHVIGKNKEIIRPVLAPQKTDE